jgi:hypothetical protein
MRAAVATAAAEAAEEEGSRAATSHGYNGKQAWQQKEAAAHALYSRRLQVLPVSARVIRQHTSAYVCIRRHTSAYGCACSLLPPLAGVACFRTRPRF